MARGRRDGLSVLSVEVESSEGSASVAPVPIPTSTAEKIYLEDDVGSPFMVDYSLCGGSRSPLNPVYVN